MSTPSTPGPSTAGAIHDRAERYGRLLAAAGGTATKADLRAQLDLDSNQAARVVRDLLAAGHVSEHDRRTALTLTPAGRARYMPLPPAQAGALLDRVLDGWPARPAAFVRLAALAVLARPFTGSAPRLGFALIGGTGTGKTSAGTFLAALAGQDPDAHLLHLPALTDSPSGRRERDKDAPTGYTFTPAGWVGARVVCLDEWDKATAAVRADLLGTALQTRGRVTIEGERIDLHPVPVLTANPAADATGTDRLAALGDTRTGPAVARRCVVLDTGRRASTPPADLARIGAAADQLDPADRLPLDTFTMPTQADPEALETLAEFLEHALTDAGRDITPDAAALEPLARACHALDPEGIPVPVAVATVLTSYLTVVESIPGQVRPEWAPSLAAWAEDNDHAGPAVRSVRRAVAAAETERDRARQAAAVARAEITAAADTITEQATAAAERCRLAEQRLDGRALTARGATADQKAEAAGLRKRLRDCRDELARVRSTEGLARATSRAAEPLRRGTDLADRIDAEHYAHQDRTRAEREHQTEQRRAAAADRRAARRAEREHHRRTVAGMRSTLTQLRATVRVWEKHYARPDGSTTPAPLDVLTDPRRPLLTYEIRATSEPAPAGVFGRLLDRLATTEPGTWRTLNDGQPITFPGSPNRCPALTTWGPNTRAVIGPFLAYLHATEDELVAQLGTKPRAERLTLDQSPSRHQLTR